MGKYRTKYMKLWEAGRSNSVGTIYHALALCGVDLAIMGEHDLGHEIAEVANQLREKYDLRVLSNDELGPGGIKDYAWSYMLAYGASALAQARYIDKYLKNVGFRETARRWQSLHDRIRFLHACMTRRESGPEPLPVEDRLVVWDIGRRRPAYGTCRIPPDIPLGIHEPRRPDETDDDYDARYIRDVQSLRIWMKIDNDDPAPGPRPKGRTRPQSTPAERGANRSAQRAS